MPQDITVLGFDGNPASHAQIVAYDDMWENPVAPAMADADEYGKPSPCGRASLMTSRR
jgi:hypothetical protein